MSDAAPYQVIVNPTSGGGAGVRMPAEIARELGARGVAHVVHVTERAGHATELARAAALAHAHVIIAAGGDGTVHEVANGLLEAKEQDPTTPSALGLLPVGTGNDFVKVIEGTRTRAEAYDTLARGTVGRFDAGVAEWEAGREFFVNAAGTGIDVEVVRQLGPNRGTGGATPYIVALLRALRRYRALPVTIDADGRRTDAHVMMVAIANGRCIGGSFRICPDAVADDGRFDVCVFRELPLVRSLWTAAHVLRGRHTTMPGVTMGQAQCVRISVPNGTPLFFQLDGELREPARARTLTLRILPAALPVLHRRSG